MNETNSSWLTTSGIINGGTGTYISDGSIGTAVYPSSATLTISNSNNMNTQSFVAVFTVERNEDNKVISSKFVKELWVEQKPGTSLELAVAKQLDKDFDPETTVIKTIYTVTF